MIQAINLNKIYKDGVKELHVLKDIDLKIEKSEFVVIVGPSGAGKSTLLHLLGGLDTPTSGSVIFDKADLYKTSDDQRAKTRNGSIGFVFQFYHLMPEFNVIENVMMPALIKRCQIPVTRYQIKERAKQLLTRLGLAERMTHRPNQLSGGEQQRVAIARALINSPNVLYCDEPTGNLDSKTGGDVMKMLLRLNSEEGVTCIMVTHEESLASDADRVLHMKDGRIL
jgi:lipoprotein-releasing system ATP-binding protein